MSINTPLCIVKMPNETHDWTHPGPFRKGELSLLGSYEVYLPF
jgi:hypothetical protein